MAFPITAPTGVVRTVGKGFLTIINPTWVPIPARDRKVTVPPGVVRIRGSAVMGSFVRTAPVGKVRLRGRSSYIAPVYVLAPPAIVRVLGPYLISFYKEYPKKNWFKWSRIGNLDFTIGKDNIAGERPSDFKGWIYQILKLGQKAILYGESGVSIATPVNEPTPTYGLKNLLKTGLKGKNAVCGNEEFHWFITKDGNLYKLENTTNKLIQLGDQGFKCLGYLEFLKNLDSKVVMFYEPFNQYVYICDGSRGFILTPYGLGEGPATFSGLQTLDGVITYVSPVEVEPQALEVVSDVFDLRLRCLKTIVEVELGVHSLQPFYCAVDYRYDTNEDWRRTDWLELNEFGVCFPLITAVEFRLCLKQQTYEEVQIQYCKVKYQICDKRFEPALSQPTYGQGESK